jgi:MerR family transcriptional regulator, redox-sensitive transcriptional activator SoxR
VASRSSVAVSALHFYETKGLSASERIAGNQRRYPCGTLRRVAFIRVAQRVGISLADISAALATLPAVRTPDRADWARLSRSCHADLDQRIAQLKKCERLAAPH